MKLADLILEGEHVKQDFKYAVNDSRKISRSLCAFANTSGGRLLIGIKDNGAVAGIRTDEEYYMIESAAALYSYPEIPFTSKTWELKKKTVLQVNVEESKNKPHYVKNPDGTLESFVRIQDENIQAPDVLIRTWEKAKQPRGTLIRYSKSEETLFKILKEKSFATQHDLEVLAKISTAEAVDTIANMILFKILNYKYIDAEFQFSLLY